MKNYTTMISIAGSDSVAGAGIEADLKTAAALGVYAMTALTAVTAQNSQGVQGVETLSPEIIAAQIASCLSDVKAGAVKIGMTATPEIVKVIAESLRRYEARNVVMDPVAVSTAGGALCDDCTSLFAAFKEHLWPISTVITPNRREAEIILGRSLADGEISMQTAREILQASGARAVLLKGGDVDTHEVCDYLCCADGTEQTYRHPRVETTNTHGSGCSLSSAIASMLALGHPLAEAIGLAEEYIATAIADGAGYRLGIGEYGPLKHFKNL